MGLPYLDLSAVKARLLATVPLVVDDAQIYSVGERDFRSTFGQIYPAVYILRQSFDSTNAGGSSRILRQTFDTYLEVVVVAQRYEDGNTQGELARRVLSDAVFDSLHGFTIPNTDLALDLSSYTDGDPADTVNYGIHRYHTRTLYMKEVTP